MRTKHIRLISERYSEVQYLVFPSHNSHFWAVFQIELVKDTEAGEMRPKLHKPRRQMGVEREWGARDTKRLNFTPLFEI